MTISLSYACAVLSSLDDPVEREKHSDATIMHSIETVLKMPDDKQVLKKEYRNAAQYLFDKVRTGKGKRNG